MQSCPQKNPKCRCIVLAWNSLFPTSITLKFYLNQFYVIQLEWRFVFVYHKTKKLPTVWATNISKWQQQTLTLTEETVALFLYLIIIWYWDVCCPTFPLNWNKTETRFPEKYKHPDKHQHVTYQSETFLCLSQGRIRSQSDTFIKVFHGLFNLVKQDFQLARMKQNPNSAFNLCFRHLSDNFISVSYSYHLQFSFRTT